MEGKASAATSWKTALYVVLLFVAVVLAFTLLGTITSPQLAQVGGTRPDETIPVHIVELGVFGLLLGAAFVVIAGRNALPLVVAAASMTVLLDLDHLPAYLGYAEPIRPAHSLVFIVVVLAIMATTIKMLEIDLIVMSASLGHMAVDTGQFAPLSPFSFAYVQLDPYRISFAVVAVLCAVAAGLVLRPKKAAPRAGS